MQFLPHRPKFTHQRSTAPSFLTLKTDSIENLASLKGNGIMLVLTRTITSLCLLLLSFSINAQSNSIGPDIEQLIALKSKAESFSDHGAVILSRRNVHALDENGFEKSIFYRAIYITSDEAVDDYSKLVNSYNAYYHDSQIDFARVISKDGEIFNMQDDAISDVAANNDDYLDDMKQIEFAVPQLKVGNIIEYQITEQQIKAIIEGQWHSVVGFRFIKFLPAKNWLRIDPTLSASNRLTVPNSIKLNIENRNTDLKPTITKGEHTTEYYWELTDLDGVEMESSMPPIDETQPVVHLSTMNDWATINQWYSKLVTPALTKAPNVSQLARSLFAGKTTDTEKVKSVFDYMQKNVRYIGAHVNRGGYQPHTAEEVLQNAYGDCKDQTTLIVALLNEAGIAAYPTLINTYNGTTVFDSLPELNFNHMITYVETTEGNYWLDTSGQTGTFPGINALLAGKKTFVIEGESGKLVTIPAIAPTDNVANVVINYEVVDNEINVDTTMTFKGQIETNLRNYYQYTPEKLVLVEQLLSPFVHENRVSTYTATDPQDITLPFEISGNFNNLLSIGDDISRFHYSLADVQILKVFTGLMSLEPVADRQQSFYIQVPLTVNVESHYPKPWNNAELAHKESSKNFQNQFFESSHSFEEREDSVVSKVTFVLYAQTISVDDYSDFYAAIDDFKQQDASLVVFDKQLATPVSSSDVSVEEQIASARNLLDMAEFEQALTYIQGIAALHENNGEVQFLLGIAYGFSGDDDASAVALERAEELGYEF